MQPRVPTKHASPQELSARRLVALDHDFGHQLVCSSDYAALLARASNPKVSWSRCAVPRCLFYLLDYSGGPAAVINPPQAFPRRGTIDQLEDIASSYRHVIVLEQGDWTMHPANSLVATWRHCPRRGPPLYSVGSLPGDAPVRRSTAAARVGPHPERECLGRLAVIRLGSEVAPIEDLYMSPGIYSPLARYLPSQPTLGSHTPELGPACFQFRGYV
ncbi:hypothetical protein F5883DRAFT_46191 [Diaporthe sp. PMI_573]|nr:hypothetical protein F5883DRAFT_46191 [Diaporthaceae sp. PMI_573]